jgi:hypothetical protein
MILNVSDKVYTAEKVTEMLNMEVNSSEARLDIFLDDSVSAPEIGELKAAFEALGADSVFTIENNEPVSKTFSGYTLLHIANELEEETSSYCVTLTKKV